MLEGLVNRPQQDFQPPQAIGDGAGCQVQAQQPPRVQQALGGPRGEILVQEHLDPYRDAVPPFGNQLGSRWSREGTTAWAAAGPLIPPSVNHPAIGTDIDLDLFGVFRVTAGQQRLAAVGADTLLSRQFTEFLPDQKAGIIPSLGSGVARLLAPLPFGLLSLVLGIVQVIGAILQRRGFGASAEEIGLELPFFPLELLDFLL